MKKKIAVVEDEIALQKVLVEWLTSEGYEAFGITSGAVAMRELPQKLPDLILLDIILPEKDGFQVMTSLAANGATAKIPIVILSNLGDDVNRARAMKLGAVDYLVKAEFDLGGLKKVLEKILKDHNGQV